MRKGRRKTAREKPKRVEMGEVSRKQAGEHYFGDMWKKSQLNDLRFGKEGKKKEEESGCISEEKFGKPEMHHAE